MSGAVETAKRIGFKVGKEEGILGKEVAKAWRQAYGTEPTGVMRECGGEFREIKTYPWDDPVVITAIKEFYKGGQY